MEKYICGLSHALHILFCQKSRKLLFPLNTCPDNTNPSKFSTCLVYSLNFSGKISKKLISPPVAKDPLIHIIFSHHTTLLKSSHFMVGPCWCMKCILIIQKYVHQKVYSLKELKLLRTNPKNLSI